MISDFKAGTKVCQAVLLRVQKIGNSSNGGVFARGLLEDNSGKMPFIVFEAGIVDKMRSMEGPKVMMVGGMVDINKFSNDMTLQLVLQRMEEIMPEDDITHLLPNGDFDHQEYENKLQKLIKGVIGGLLQHSVDVAGIAQSLADRIGGVDKDLIVAGALLHDIGKIREISSDIGFPYTMEGRLLGHVSMSAVMVQEAAGKAKVTGPKLQQLLHIVLSHHGEQEKGSPVACATKESFIVHYADEIDAIMNQFSKNEGKNPWEYNKMLQRFLLHEA